MRKIRARVLMTATLVLTLLFSFAPLEGFADQSIKLSPNAKVEIHGTSAIINNGGGGAGEMGTWECNCRGKGQCKLTRDPNSIMCSSNGGSCTGACQLSTSTGSVTQGMTAPKAKSNSPSPAPAQSK